jgi:3-hydroxyacyl-[acyl-carrier-protein] dehydratase
MSKEEIEQRIPHRLPMLLLDEIVTQGTSHILCRKTFRDDEFFLQGHFPGNPIVPGVIQCECCLQAGAVLLHQYSTGEADRVSVVTRMDSVKFKRIVRPGDTVEIDVTLKEQLSNAFFLTGKVLLDGKPAARLDFACSMTGTGPALQTNS